MGIENRYDGTLREENKLIMEISSPAHVSLRIILSLELKKAIEGISNPRILDIGCGEGDSTEFILRFNPDLKIDALDISQEMIDVAKDNLSDYLDKINFICEDALDYLNRISEDYDIITSSWTIHNFRWEDKLKLFKQIYSRLKKGGKLMIMDRIYPDDESLSRELLDLQSKRHDYLKEETKTKMNLHQTQDFEEDYRMDESQTIKVLEEIGFKDVKIIDRVERDVVLIASK